VEASTAFRGLFGVALRVGFERTSLSNVTQPAGTVSYTWTLGTLDGCPMQWKRWRFAVLPCARVEAGVLEGSGVTPEPKVSDTAKRGWLAVDVLGRVRWSPIPVVSLELEGGIRAALLRDQWIIEQAATLYYQPPAFSAVGGADLHVAFW
jgi:hypothetical protein